jgi:hypothetical protein
MTIQPGTGYTFTSSSLGTNFNIEKPWSEWEGGGSAPLQQFQLVLNTITVGEGEEKSTKTMLSVVQGNMLCTDLVGANEVWVSKFTKSCIPPSEVIGIVGTDESTFINCESGTANPNGPGGYQLPYNKGEAGAYCKYGIYLVQINNQKTDFNPIIFIANADEDFVEWMYKLPTVIPDTVIDKDDLGLNEYPAYDLITIGTISFAPISKQWIIDQSAIGTLTMVEPVKTGPQIPTWYPAPEATPAPFQCSQGRVVVGQEDFWCLKIGKGSISYSVSNMPEIKLGAISNQYQAYYEGCTAFVPGTGKTDNDADVETSHWMLGGGYDLPAAGGSEYSLFAVYWDLDPATYSGGGDAVRGYPVLCLINSDNAPPCFKETGPGYYYNLTNIKRMDGYANKFEGKDWGFCHTTYFNPMKFGFAAKKIAKITAVPVEPGTVTIEKLQEADGTRNRIDIITFNGEVKGGGIRFKFDNDVTSGDKSAYFYPQQDQYARQLYLALQEIPKLKRNILVSQVDNYTFYVTYINHLQMREYWGTDLDDGEYKLEVDTNELTWFDKKYEIEQYHAGSLEMMIPLQFNGTQLLSKEGWKESEDPFYINKNSGWEQVVNKSDPAFTISGAQFLSNPPMRIVSNETPAAYTRKDFYDIYFMEDGCNNTCEFSFQVKKSGDSYSVCLGMVNNVMLTGTTTFTLSNNDYIYLICATTTSGASVYPSEVTADSDADVPDDTDIAGHIAIAQLVDGQIVQLVNGSLWSDRIKFGESVATYYFAKV